METREARRRPRRRQRRARPASLPCGAMRRARPPAGLSSNSFWVTHTCGSLPKRWMAFAAACSGTPPRADCALASCAPPPRRRRRSRTSEAPYSATPVPATRWRRSCGLARHRAVRAGAPVDSGAGRRHAALGPAAAWMRGALPVLLVPGFVSGRRRDAAGSNCAGVLRRRGRRRDRRRDRHAAAVRAAPPLVVDARAGRRRQRGCSSSRRTAALGSSAAPAPPPRLAVAGPSRAACMAPAYAASASPRTWRRRRAAGDGENGPPNVGCAIVLALFFRRGRGGGALLPRRRGCGAARRGAAVHGDPRAVRAHAPRRPASSARALALCAVTCPLLLFGWAPPAPLGLPAENVASFLPASTTTGSPCSCPAGCRSQSRWIAAAPPSTRVVPTPRCSRDGALASRSALRAAWGSAARRTSAAWYTRDGGRRRGSGRARRRGRRAHAARRFPP